MFRSHLGQSGGTNVRVALSQRGCDIRYTFFFFVSTDSSVRLPCDSLARVRVCMSVRVRLRGE